MYSVTLKYPMDDYFQQKLSADLALCRSVMGPSSGRWHIKFPASVTSITYHFSLNEDFVWFKLAVAADHPVVVD